MVEEAALRELPLDRLTHAIYVTGRGTPPRTFLAPPTNEQERLADFLEQQVRAGPKGPKRFTIGGREVVFAQDHLQSFDFLSDGAGNPAALSMQSMNHKGIPRLNGRWVDYTTTIIDVRDGSLWFSGGLTPGTVGILGDRLVIWEDSLDGKHAYLLCSRGASSEILTANRTLRKPDDWRPLGVCSRYILECNQTEVRAIDPEQRLVVAQARVADLLKPHNQLADDERAQMANIYAPEPGYGNSSYCVGNILRFRFGRRLESAPRTESVTIDIVEKRESAESR